MVYGISSERAGAPRCLPRTTPNGSRLALDAMVWTGKGEPHARPSVRSGCRNSAPETPSIDRAFVHSIFNRDHPGSADEKSVDAFADAILALDDSVPTGTYVDMCANLRWLTRPRSVATPHHARPMGWQSASVEGLVEFFTLLPIR